MSTYETAVPGSVGAAQTALLAKTAYQQALARINQRRMGTLREYGYTGQIDPNTGVLTGVAVDTNNPYGQLQETLGLNAEEAQAGEDMMTERGVRGGLARQQEGRLQHAFGRRKAALGQGLVGSLGSLQDEQQGAKAQMDAALYQAQLEAARNAIANEEFNPANVGGLRDAAEPFTEDPPKAAAANVDASGRQAAGPVGVGKVQWGSGWVNRDQLIRQLVARGVKPSSWAQKHPAAAKKLGISPKNNANNALIKKALKGRR